METAPTKPLFLPGYFVNLQVTAQACGPHSLCGCKTHLRRLNLTTLNLQSLVSALCPLSSALYLLPSVRHLITSADNIFQKLHCIQRPVQTGAIERRRDACPNVERLLNHPLPAGRRAGECVFTGLAFGN